MEEPERVNTSTEAGRPRQHIGPIRDAQVPADAQLSRVMNLREARLEFGLDHRAIYAAVERGQIHAFKVGGTGRIYYPEWELRELANLLKAQANELVDDYAA